MATTTKSTRKKPVKTVKVSKVVKTAKKPVVITTKTESVQTVKTKKDDVKKSEISKNNKSAKKQLTPLERLKSLHVALVATYLIFAAIIIGLVDTASKAVTLPIAAKDEFASKDTTVLSSAHEVLYNIEPKYVLAASLLLSALFSLLLATKLRNKYEASLTNKTSGLRWLALGLSAALLFEYVGLLVGINDIWLLKLTGGLILIAGLFGWIAERDNVGALTPKWLAYVFSIVAGVLAWLPILGSLIGTTLFGDERFSWYVYAIVAVLFIGSLRFARNQYKQLTPTGQQTDYISTESRYLNIDMLTKFAIVIITWLALK